MATLQVKNVPDVLDQRLRVFARSHGRSLSDVILSAIEKELERQEWNDRLATHPKTNIEVSVASIIEQEREDRERELS